MVVYPKQKTEPQPRLTPQEYLEREHKAERKSEYHGGIVVAMAGASPEHYTIYQQRPRGTLGTVAR
ncbi:MAG TPA: hypothetical protein VFB38_07955 [Chthonomonadaceae bacterium]|nr:hypothetical protein [Chthonomonadaceae bacterium]